MALGNIYYDNFPDNFQYEVNFQNQSLNRNHGIDTDSQSYFNDSGVDLPTEEQIKEENKANKNPNFVSEAERSRGKGFNGIFSFYNGDSQKSGTDGQEQLFYRNINTIYNDINDINNINGI